MCATFAARTPDTGNITGRALAHPFTDSAGVLLLTTPARSPPLTREAAGVSLWSFPPQFRFAGPPTGACRERNVPVLCWIFDCQGAWYRLTRMYLCEPNPVGWNGYIFVLGERQWTLFLTMMPLLQDQDTVDSDESVNRYISLRSDLDGLQSDKTPIGFLCPSEWSSVTRQIVQQDH